MQQRGKEDMKRVKIVIDACLEVLRGSTILPGKVENQTILNIYQQNIGISPQVQAIIKAHEKTFDMWPYNEDGSLKPGFEEDWINTKPIKE